MSNIKKYWTSQVSIYKESALKELLAEYKEKQKGYKEMWVNENSFYKMLIEVIQEVLEKGLWGSKELPERNKTTKEISWQQKKADRDFYNEGAFHPHKKSYRKGI